MRKIRVLVVEDSMVFRNLLVQGLNQDRALEVVATASDPFEARDKIIEYRPDVMTLDIELPRMSGLEFLRKLMPQYPLPVVIISALSEKVFDAMKAGAVDFVAKPQVTEREQLRNFLCSELPVKIKVASTARVSRYKKPVAFAADQHLSVRSDIDIIAIGASTGGTEAIAEVIRDFSTDIPGTVIVQHMPPGFTEMYANRLDSQSRVKVKEAKNGDMVAPGQVLIAPGGSEHMSIVKVGDNYKVVLKKGEKVNGHCPSVDVLFNSVADVSGAHAIGIILTGMGGDGAKGLLKMQKNGARTIGQDEASCIVYGMPKVAYDLGAVMYQEKLSDIAKKTYTLLNQR